MPREWLFTGRWLAWPRRCARSDSAVSAPDVTAALVDRRPVDWNSLRALAKTVRDRQILDNLQLIEHLREPRSRRPELPRRSHAFTVLAVVAALQAIVCLGAAAAAGVGGDWIAQRTFRVAVAVAFGAAAAMLWPAAARDGRSLFLLAAYAAGASAFARAAISSLPAAYTDAVAPLLRGIYPEAFVPACLWQFALDFPRVRRFTPFDRYARRAAAVAAAAGSFLFAINAAAAYGADLHAPFLLRNHPQNAFWTVLTLFAAPALIVVLVRTRRAAPAERRRTARFALGVVSGFGPLLATGAARAAVPAFDRWFLSVQVGRTWLDAIVLGALLAVPLMSAIALRCDRPFERALVLTARRRQLLVGAMSAAIVAAPFAATAVIAHGLPGITLAEIISRPRGWWIAAPALTGVVLVFARHHVRLALERALAGGADCRLRLLASLERLRRSRSRVELIEQLADEIESGVSASRVWLLTSSAAGVLGDAAHQIGPLHAGSAVAGDRVLRERPRGPAAVDRGHPRGRVGPRPLGGRLRGRRAHPAPSVGGRGRHR
jgi:hypothetical protein